MSGKVCWVLVVVGVLGGCGSSDTGSAPAGNAGKGASSAASLTGAGSTFVNPAMSKWTYAFHDANPGITINYQAVGSGAGVGQYQAGTVDFAATDAPLKPKEVAGMANPTIEIPVIAGSAVLAYNLAGIGNGLKLSGDVIADMFLGKIKTWNDPRIAQQNPKLTLPATPIAIVHRSDGSGTTYMFTDYLCAVSPDWKSGPGMGKTVNWPVGVGGKGSDGVAGLIKQTPGSIGYVEVTYAAQTSMTYGPIRNKSGAYVDATGAMAAANGVASKLKDDISTSLVNSDAKDAYPIAGFTYVLVSAHPKDPVKGKATVDFLKWVLGPGQDMAKQLQYAPLPKSVVDLDTAALSQVKTG